MSSATLSQWRNRLVASIRFRRWVQNTPGMRLIARRRAARLFRLMTGFVDSQVLLACIELNLLERVATESLSCRQLAARLNLPVHRLSVLLEAATELDLLERCADDSYGLGATGASLLSEPGLLALARHHRALYHDLADPVALLRGDSRHSALGKFWPYAQSNSGNDIETGEVRDYTDVMGESQRMVAEQVVSSGALDARSRLLDVGGGNGNFVATLAQHYPVMMLSIFDLPAVIPLARSNLKSLNLASRVALFEGDFHRNELPASHTLITLIRILHDHDDEPAQQLLDGVYRTLEPGGTVLVAEPLKAQRGAEAMNSVYFGFYLLAMGSGRPRTYPEIETMLLKAGFRRVKRHPTPLPLICSVITASA